MNTEGGGGGKKGGERRGAGRSSLQQCRVGVYPTRGVCLKQSLNGVVGDVGWSGGPGCGCTFVVGRIVFLGARAGAGSRAALGRFAMGGAETEKGKLFGKKNVGCRTRFFFCAWILFTVAASPYTPVLPILSRVLFPFPNWEKGRRR